MDGIGKDFGELVAESLRLLGESSTSHDNNFLFSHHSNAASTGSSRYR
jgi:hypothetical protein